MLVSGITIIIMRHTNYGTAPQNGAYCIPGASGGVNSNRALIHFDLSSLPSANNILSAKLNLYAMGPAGTLSGHTGTSNSAYLQRIITTWSDNTVTWNTAPASTSTNQVTLPVSTSATQDYLNIDVTALIKDMLNNSSTSFGFMLKLVNETTTNALLFYSIDCGNTAKFPVLQVTVDCSAANAIIETNKQIFEGLSTYPNPTNGSVEFKYNLTKKSQVVISLYSVMGQKISELFNGISNEGENIFRSDFTGQKNGFYFIRTEIENQSYSSKILKMD
jgi:hypothetical protein